MRHSFKQRNVRRAMLPLQLQELESRWVPAVSFLGPRTVTELNWLSETGGNLWKIRSQTPAAEPGQVSYLKTTASIPAELNVNSIAKFLSAAPMESTPAAKSHPLELTLPRPDGTYAEFRVWEYALMEPKLAAKFPSFKFYSGQGVDDPAATLGISVTSLGFSAQVLAPSGTWYIDPHWHLDTKVYDSYYRKNAIDDERTDRVCVDDIAAELPKDDHDDVQEISNGTSLRTFRLAVAATGEYTTFFAKGATTNEGKIANAEAAISKTHMRVNQIYERDLAVRLTLVDNTSIIYLDPDDPYTDGDTKKMVDENQANINPIIGTDNYDIGHVVGQAGTGGFAPGRVGVDGQKARGATTRGTPEGDPFDVDYVAHEIGHQFSASHTFNGNQSKNASQRTAATAVEPGSGTTIMSYAGIMDADNVQPNSDDYFHIVSIEQIVNYVASIPSVGTTTTLLNTITGWFVPVMSMVIPANTPFALSMGAIDSGGNTIEYTFEERDLGVAAPFLSPDNGSSPLFRSRPPSIEGTRYFPAMNILATNANPATFAEQLPNTNRTMTFTATARNNAPGGGAIVSIDNIKVQAVTNGGPFRVTEPGTIDTKWAGKSSQMINWTVAGTTANGINASNVEITMSTDGGLTYPTTLLSSTPNDGAELITVPNIDADFARIKVTGISDGVGKTFFDINDVNIKIIRTPTVTTWLGGDSEAPSNWFNPDNWTHGPPQPGDTAVFQAFGTENIAPELNGAVSIGSLKMDATWNGLLRLNAPLTLTGASQWDAGLILVEATKGGSLTNTGTVTLNNPSEIRIGGGGTWTNEGTMIQVGAGGLAIDGKTTTLFTTSTGVYDLQSDSYVSYNSGPGNFQSVGTLRRSPGVGTGTGLIDCSFYLSGTIDVQSTKLSIAPAGGTSADVTDVMMSVTPGATLAFGQSISYSGILSGLGGGSVQLTMGNSSLAGNTTLSFPAPMLQWLSGDLNLKGKSLTNVAGSSFTMTGQGFTRLTGSGTFINKGSFISTSTSSIYVNGAGTTFKNDVGALVDLRNTGGISYESISGMFTSAGTIRHSVGTGNASIQTNFAIGGTLEVLSGRLTLACFVPGSGTVTNVTAAIDKSATLNLTGLQSTVNYAGTLTCVGGPNGKGTVTNGVFGQVNIISDTTVNFPDNMFQWAGGTINVAAGAILINPAGSFMTLSSGGSFTLNGGGTLMNNGWMRHTGSGNLAISGAGTTLKNSPTGTYELRSDADLSFSGTTGTFLNQGAFRKSVSSGNSQITTAFINSGGTVDIQTGLLDTPGTFDLGKGTLSGSGTLVSPVTNSDGFIRPGNSPGKLTVNGTYVQSGTGFLNIELNGTTVGTQYDQLAVNGTVTLGGPLSVVLTYPAKINDTFTIINNDNFSSNDAVTGTFDGLIEGAQFTVNSATMQISYKGGDGNDVQLKVITAPSANAAKVASIQINDGTAQRSRVTSLQVTFDQIVSLPNTAESAFELKRKSDNAVVTLLPIVNNSGPSTVVTFTFTGGPLDFGSLTDGRYVLTAKSALIGSAGGALDGNGDGSPGGDYVVVGDPDLEPKLFRLFGDGDGSGVIDLLDYGSFRAAFGTSSSFFSFDGIGPVDLVDFGQFRLQFGKMV